MEEEKDTRGSIPEKNKIRALHINKGGGFQQKTEGKGEGGQPSTQSHGPHGAPDSYNILFGRARTEKEGGREQGSGPGSCLSTSKRQKAM